MVKKNDRQNIGAGNWLLPGGTLRFNEEIELSLMRELREETNLEIVDLQLLASKKMIIGDTHWLGVYFLVNVKNESELTNVEQHKHEQVAFVPLQEVPSLKDYSILQFIKGIDLNREYFDAQPVSPADHAMGDALLPYMLCKVHSVLRNNVELFSRIKIIGNYDRSIHVSKDEKNDKLLNFKRPTAFIDGDVLYICCFPGSDYAYHYAALVASYLKTIRCNTEVSYILPSTSVIENSFASTNIAAIPDADVVVFGNVDRLGLFEESSFHGDGDFLWKTGRIGQKSVLLLGCTFSIWGSSGYDFIKALSQHHAFSTFVYVGKLGALSPDIAPNARIATGAQSYINGETITWENMFKNVSGSNIVFGDHVTCASVLDETKKRISFLKRKGDFIDPEIGNMALACRDFGRNFSYAHVISDNVVRHDEFENLSNERREVIFQKRNRLFKEIGEILRRSL